MWFGFQSQGDLGPLGGVNENVLRSPKQESPCTVITLRRALLDSDVRCHVHLDQRNAGIPLGDKLARRETYQCCREEEWRLYP